MSKRQREAGGKQQKSKKKQKTVSKSTKAVKQIKTEVKSFDNALSFLIDSTGEIPATGQLLTGIVQGQTVSTRIGNKIQLSSIQIEGTCKYSPGAGAQMGTMCVVKLVEDKQCNGAVATISGDKDSIFTSNVLPSALRDLDNQDRFKVLKTWKFPFNASAGVTTAYSDQVMDFSGYKKLKNQQVYFGASTGAITDLRAYNLFLVAGTDGGGDDAATCSATARINFYDL